jgi:hypothetical protein
MHESGNGQQDEPKILMKKWQELAQKKRGTAEKEATK